MNAGHGLRVSTGCNGGAIQSRGSHGARVGASSAGHSVRAGGSRNAGKPNAAVQHTGQRLARSLSACLLSCLLECLHDREHSLSDTSCHVSATHGADLQCTQEECVSACGRAVCKHVHAYVHERPDYVRKPAAACLDLCWGSRAAHSSPHHVRQGEDCAGGAVLPL